MTENTHKSESRLAETPSSGAKTGQDNNKEARKPRPAARTKARKRSAPKKASKAVKTARKTTKNATRKTLNATEKNMTRNTQKFERVTQEANDMNREGMEAFVQSGTLFAKGFEDIVRTSVTLAQETAEKQAQYMKEALSSKTINEWADVQNKIARESFDDFMSGATKISELSIRLITEASEPLNSQMNKGLKKAGDIAA